MGTEAIIQTVFSKPEESTIRPNCLELAPNQWWLESLAHADAPPCLALSLRLSLSVTLVQLLQLRPPQREGLERGIRGAGGRVPPRGQRALQRPAGEHDPEQRAAAHQCLQQRCPPDPHPGEQTGPPGQGRVSLGVDGLTAGIELSSVRMCVCTYIQQVKADISPAFPPQPHL